MSSGSTNILIHSLTITTVLCFEHFYIFSSKPLFRPVILCPNLLILKPNPANWSAEELEDAKKKHGTCMNKLSDLHGAPWFKTGVCQVHVVSQFFDRSSPAARLVAGEQAPASGSEAGQHGHRWVCVCVGDLKSINMHWETSWRLQRTLPHTRTLTHTHSWHLGRAHKPYETQTWMQGREMISKWFRKK